MFDAVNDIQFANLNSNLIKTDISSGTNNTTLASSAAIKSYVDTVAGAGLSTALYTFSNGSKNSDGNISGCSETSDPDNLASTNGSSITVPSGYYIITWECEHYDTRQATGGTKGALLTAEYRNIQMHQDLLMDHIHSFMEELKEVLKVIHLLLQFTMSLLVVHLFGQTVRSGIIKLI